MTRTLEADVAFTGRATLGEGPAWDAAGERLIWVDIAECAVHELRQAAGGGQKESRAWVVPEEVGAAAPRASGGLLLAVRSGLATLDEDGTYAELAPVEADRPNNRMNDAKCDPQGRLWAGTMTDRDPDVDDAALYRLDPDGSIHTVLADVRLSNGMGWSPDERTFYYIDTRSGGVDAFDFDPADAAISNRRRLVDVADGGKPDGMTTDDEGCLWVAAIGSGQVRRYTPRGDLDTVVNLPATRVTSCAFGGPGRAHLFMTTAREQLSDRELTEQPHAGDVFHCEPGVTGPPATPFAG